MADPRREYLDDIKADKDLIVAEIMESIGDDEIEYSQRCDSIAAEDPNVYVEGLNHLWDVLSRSQAAVDCFMCTFLHSSTDEDTPIVVFPNSKEHQMMTYLIGAAAKEVKARRLGLVGTYRRDVNVAEA